MTETKIFIMAPHCEGGKGGPVAEELFYLRNVFGEF